MPDIFVSYSKKDKVIAKRVVDALRGRGVTVWHDVDEVLVGHDLVDSVFDGIRKSRYFAILLTRHSGESQWVNRELNTALIREIEQSVVVVLPLLLEECEIPIPLASKRYANFAEDFDQGLDEVIRSISTTISVSDLGERKLYLEDRLEERYTKSLQLASELIEMTQTSETDYVLTGLSEDNVNKFLNVVRECIRFIDELVELEDSPDVLLEHYQRGINLASIARDYPRQAHYAMRIVEDTPCVDNWLLLGVAFASDDQRAKSIESFRKAMRLYRERLEGALDDTTLMKFLYRLTKHVRVGWSNKPTLISILYHDHTKMRNRLEKSLEFFEDALRRDFVIDFDDTKMLSWYAFLLLRIGLSRRGIKLLDPVMGSGFELKEDEQSYIEDQRRLTEEYEASGGSGAFSMDIGTLINFSLQFGVVLDSSFEELTEQSAPEFYRNIMQDDPVFRASE